MISYKMYNLPDWARGAYIYVKIARPNSLQNFTDTRKTMDTTHLYIQINLSNLHVSKDWNLNKINITVRV